MNRPVLIAPRGRAAAALAGLLLLGAGCGRVDPRWQGPGSVTRLARIEDKFPATVQQLRAEVDKDPNSSETRVRLAEEYLRHDYLRDAAEEFHLSLEADPQNINALLGLWQVQARLNDTANLIEIAQRMQQINPQDPNAPVVLQEAARAFEDALIIRPQDPWVLINAALCQAKMKRWDQAEAYTRRASATVPSALTPRLMLGTLYLDQGLVGQAADVLARLADAQPNNAMVHEALGRARRAQGQLQDALNEFRSAQRLRPAWHVAYLNAGEVNLQMGQCADAEQQFQKALEIAPHLLRAGLDMVQALSCEEKFDRAVAASEQLRVDFPDSPEVMNNLAFLYAETGQKLDLARYLATSLLKRYAANGVIQDTAGWVLYRQGQYTDALAHLQRARQLAPGNSGIQFHLGKVLLALGRRPEANEAFHAALSGGLPAREAAEAQEAAAKL